MSIAEKLAAIQKLSASLNAETDSLNETFQLIDQGLARSGVKFWWRAMEFGSYILSGTRYYYRLGYTKIGETWCLSMQQCGTVELEDGVTEGEEDSTYDDPIPLTRAPRSLRIEASAVLEEFLDAYHDALADMEARVKRAKAFAQLGGGG